MASKSWTGNLLPKYPTMGTATGQFDARPTLHPPRKQPILPKTNPDKTPTPAKSPTCQKFIFLTLLINTKRVTAPPNSPPQKFSPGYLVKSGIFRKSSAKRLKLKATNKTLAPKSPPKSASKQRSKTFSSSSSKARANLQAKNVPKRKAKAKKNPKLEIENSPIENKTGNTNKHYHNFTSLTNSAILIS